MGEGDRRCVFPLTSLQIGDLQSYLSDISLFLANDSKKLYILVDNRPWLRDLGSRGAHFWQLMVTKRVLLPVKNLRNSLRFSIELHRTLYGFIVFEVVWSSVCGINYLNELQTDTSLYIEARVMQRWEFDSIDQAASCMSTWFSGTISEQQQLKEHLDSTIGSKWEFHLDFYLS
ncbi:uncharacterized protein G2W53_029238 [Senna tora]|uniref:Uncharacterized protein n=1 Tax=Senna tora TaxID=362788 RepID=A0A834WFJ6_9FABA|nr:uncharacterized protein G2W53_029238 [Senna tora]